MTSHAVIKESFKMSYTDAMLQETKRKLFEEDKIKNSFSKELQHPRQRSEFDEVFGENPLDFLMTEFGLAIYEAETNRAAVEAHGRPPAKHIAIPPAMTFEKMQQLMLQQCTERPDENYFESYLLEDVRKALSFAFEEAEKLGIESDHRFFKLFCPLDFIAESLWRNNRRYPARLEQNVKREEIPMFKEFFEKFPREPPPLHLRCTIEEATTIIQKRWRGTMTRRRPDIKALRRHMAAVKVQYCDPFKLVDEIWERRIPPSRLKAFEHTKKKEPALPWFNPVRPQHIYPKPTNEPIPEYLVKIKADIQKKIEEENNDPVRKDAIERRWMEQMVDSESEVETEIPGSPTLVNENVLVNPELSQLEESKMTPSGQLIIGKPDGSKDQKGICIEMPATPSIKSSGVGKPLATLNMKDTRDKTAIIVSEVATKKPAKKVALAK